MITIQTSSTTVMVFDDENAASQYKQVLIERFCKSDVSSAQVALAFDAAKILKKV